MCLFRAIGRRSGASSRKIGRFRFFGIVCVCVCVCASGSTVISMRLYSYIVDVVLLCDATCSNNNNERLLLDLQYKYQKLYVRKAHNVSHQT